MEDVSELFKRHFNLLHKGTTIAKTVQDRKEAHNNARKSKRDSLTYMRRHISKDMSPINTPTSRSRLTNNKNVEKVDVEPEKATAASVSTKARSKPEGVSKRLELLQKWKAEKAKLKEQEKAKAKPIFKVYHVNSDSTTDIENVNKTIKGKPIVPGSASKNSKFAPPNHKFRPPQGIKPINFNISTGQTQASTTALNKLKCTPQQKAKNVAGIKNPLTGFSSTSSMGSSMQGPSTSRYVPVPKVIKEKSLKPENKTNIKENSKPTVVRCNKDEEDGLIEEVKKKPTVAANRTRTSTNIKANRENTKASHTSIKKPSPTLNQPVTRKTRKVQAEKAANAKAVQKSPKKTSKRTVGWSVRISDATKGPSDGDSMSKITLRKTPKNPSVSAEKEQIDSEAKTDNNSIEVITLDYRVSEPKKDNNSTEIISLDDTEEESLKNTLNSSNACLQNNDDLSNSVGAEPPLQPVTGSSSSSSSDYSVDYDSCTEQTTASGSDYKTPPVYVSPFVTISRGKNSARKEYQIRTSHGKCFDRDTPEVKKILSAHTSPKAGAAYFHRKLDTEIARIIGICNDWETYLKSQDLPEEAHSSIDVAIGQSKLLISKKFQQFRSLISQCETENYNDKPVTCEDLHGFWDMIYMQVGDLDKRFDNLQKLKENNWEEMLPQKKFDLVKKPRGRPKKVQGKSKLMQLIQEAKNKKKEQPTENIVLINGLDYARILKTPPREKSQSLEGSNSSKRKSLLVSVLSRGTSSRCSSSPGLTMMKISQSIKQGDGLTPARSILKSDVFKSTGKKSVVFKDLDKSPKPLRKTNLFLDEEKENVSDNLIKFSPPPAPFTPPRRSSRICKLKL